MTISRIIKFIENKYPLKNAAEWDFVGLLLGSGRRQVKNVLITLDLTSEILDYAIENKVSFIITHHPFIFDELSDEGLEREFTKYSYKKKIYNRIQNLDIALYSLHTNYDASKDGTVDNLLNTLGLLGEKIISCPYGKKVNKPMNIKALKTLINSKFKNETILTNKDEHFFSSCVGFLPGSCSIEDLVKAKKEGCGIIVSSDIKWSSWIWAKEENVCLLEISHSVENVFVEYLEKLLKHKFKEIKIFSQKLKEIAKIY